MITIPFFGSCSAGASLVIVSQRIAWPFKLKSIRAHFAQGANNLLALRFYHAQDNQAPASGAPSGFCLFSELGQVDYLIGNNDTKVIEHELTIRDTGSYLKVYAVNSDTVAHTIDVQMTIEEIERE